MMLQRWRYRGRHRGRRGCFPDYYRSVEAHTAAQQLTADFVAAREIHIQMDYAAARRRQLNAVLGPYEQPELFARPVNPTLVFDTAPPRDRSGWGDGGLLEYLTGDAPLTLTLWLPGDDLADDDEQAALDRLMAMEGA